MTHDGGLRGPGRLLDAGRDLGLVRVGAKAYSTANLESGWIPSPMPAVFGDEMSAYREWLDVTKMGSLGGSMDSTDITDYYVTPYDIGYGRVVAFDHEFVGRAALEEIAAAPHRQKVTLVWRDADVLAAVRTLYETGTPAKYIEMPKARYALFQMDTVVSDGRQVGLSMDAGHLANERVMVSLAVVEPELAQPGTEVTVLWGEKRNSAKPTVEEHRQVEVRATVAQAPYVRFARDTYRRT